MVFGAPAVPAVIAAPSPGPVIVTLPWRSVPIPQTYLSSSLPLGNPATSTPQPLVVTPPQRWPLWTASLASASPVLVILARTPTVTVDLSRLTVAAEIARLPVAVDLARDAAVADLSRVVAVQDLTRAVVVAVP
jgi:hypothetical protein